MISFEKNAVFFEGRKDGNLGLEDVQEFLHQ